MIITNPFQTSLVVNYCHSVAYTAGNVVRVHSNVTYQDSVSSFCIDDAGEDDVLDGVEDDAAVGLGGRLSVQTGAWK